MTNLFSEKFSSHLKNLLVKASEEARICANERNIDAARSLYNTNIQRQKPILTLEHVMDALINETGSIASEILKKSSAKNLSSKSRAKPMRMTKAIRPTDGGKQQENLVLDPVVAKAIVKAVQISQQYMHRYVGTEHLLKGLLFVAPKDAKNWLAQKSIETDELEKNIQVVLESTSKFPDLTAVFRSESEVDSKQDRKQQVLEYFGQELTNAKAQKNIDPIIGREREIERLISILCRRYKNNPILVGEAGVGKTAIVEGLAKRISQGSVPPILANKKIYTIDLGAMVAGTIYRGEFEARLKQALEAAQKDKNTILFIDEMHNIIGAGSASGSLDAANILKPALARGAISIIGATTLEEYKKHIETDSALERRLQPILVEEPSAQETKEVLRGIKENYEAFHNVIITEEAIDAAVKLSERYIPDKLQPDKSIDLIDEAAARVKIKRSNNEISRSIQKVESELENTIMQKQDAVSREQYGDAINLKEYEKKLRNEYEFLVKQANERSNEKTAVTKDNVVEIISSITKIPLGKIETSERGKLSSLEAQLGKEIFGQDEALLRIANLIRRSRTKVADPSRPIASFMFIGPSGTGKTQTAKQLSGVFFGSESSLITIDMSEFSEGFSVSKLIGAPAGYVGYRDSNKFTDLVRTNPYSVVLLDEIEKAHPEIFNLLLQILENGQIADSTGRMINFRNTIIIMTSNIGIDAFNKTARLGFSEQNAKPPGLESAEKAAREQLLTRFKPEFLNRIDSIVAFKPLDKKAFFSIIQKYAQELNHRLSEEDIKIQLTAQAQKHILTNGYRAQTGARGVRKLFQDKVESEIAKLLIEKNAKNKSIVVDEVKGNLEFSIE